MSQNYIQRRQNVSIDTSRYFYIMHLFSAITCNDPGTIPNGRRSGFPPYQCNSVVTYTCLSGYQLTGTATRTCTSAREWSGSLPVCSPIGSFISRIVTEKSGILKLASNFYYSKFRFFIPSPVHHHRNWSVAVFTKGQ